MPDPRLPRAFWRRSSTDPIERKTEVKATLVQVTFVAVLLGLLGFATPSVAQTQCIANVAAQGTSDAITSAALPCGTTTNLVILTAAAANTTTTPTYAPVGSPPLKIVRSSGVPVAAGDLQIGYVALLTSTGSSWVLLNPAQSIALTGLAPGVTSISPKSSGSVLWDNNGVLADSLGPLQAALQAALPNATTSQLYGGSGVAGAAGVFPAGANVPAWLLAPTSANLAAAVTDGTGSGPLVFANSPVFTTPNIGSATGHASLDLPLTGGTMSGPINMGSQAITNIPSLPNLSSNVESTGIPGLDVGHWFIWNNSATLDTINTLRVDRQVSYTGGTPGNTYDAFWANCVVGANVADYEWCNKTVVTNNATAGQNVAIYGQITKTSTGPTWGFVTQALDTSLAANPTGGLYGQEIDIEASGTDTNLARFGLDIIGWTVPSGTKPTFSYGVFIECSGNSSANCQYTNGVALGTATYNIGLNLAAGTFTTYSIDAPGFTVDPTGNTIANSFSATTTIQTGGYAIGSLPTCNAGAKGLRTFVTNAQTTPTFLGTVSTTGAVVAPVFCNGSSWIYGLLDTPANDSLDVMEKAA